MRSNLQLLILGTCLLLFTAATCEREIDPDTVPVEIVNSSENMGKLEINARIVSGRQVAVVVSVPDDIYNDSDPDKYPDDVTVTIEENGVAPITLDTFNNSGDKPYYTKNEFFLEPGVYDVIAIKNGFETASAKIVIPVVRNIDNIILNESVPELNSSGTMNTYGYEFDLKVKQLQEENYYFIELEYCYEVNGVLECMAFLGYDGLESSSGFALYDGKGILVNGNGGSGILELNFITSADLEIAYKISSLNVIVSSLNEDYFEDLLEHYESWGTSAWDFNSDRPVNTNVEGGFGNIYGVSVDTWTIEL